MVFSHLILGFLTSYVGYILPSMLNLTASKLYIENNRKIAQEFIIGASLIVLFQVFLAVKLSEIVEEFPEFIFWIKKLGIIVFTILSIFFVYKGIARQKEKEAKPVKNGFVLGLSLSSANMFAIPFFAVAHSSFIMHNWAMSGFTCTLLFGIGTVLGTFAILSSYLLLTKKLEVKVISYARYFNLLIGIIMGLVSVYSIIKFYF